MLKLKILICYFIFISFFQIKKIGIETEDATSVINLTKTFNIMHTLQFI